MNWYQLSDVNNKQQLGHPWHAQFFRPTKFNFLLVATILTGWIITIYAQVQPSLRIKRQLAVSRTSKVSAPAQGALRLAKIPVRSRQAATGSQLFASMNGLAANESQEVFWRELTSGNVPSFLRTLAPLTHCQVLADGKNHCVKLFLSSDYLAVGNDQDFVRVPVNLYIAKQLAAMWDLHLPTKKMVDLSFAHAPIHLAPQPMEPGDLMTSNQFILAHNRMIAGQLAGKVAAGQMIAGHKKDIIVTIADAFDRIPIYGWHRPNGVPIQPISTFHPASYADYSHGLRLVSKEVVVDGQKTTIDKVLRDPLLAPLLSDEG